MQQIKQILAEKPFGMRLGMLTDIHENTEMLREALRLAEINRCDELVCLGDIVGHDRRFYKNIKNKSGKQCLNLIRTNCRYIVAGNHDLFASQRFPSYSDGFRYSDKWFSMNSEDRKSLSEGKVWSYEYDDPADLDDDDISFLKSLPEFITTSFNGLQLIFSHYIYPDLTGSTTTFIERNYQLKDAWNFMEQTRSKYYFYGHSHGCFAGFAYRDSFSFLKAFHAIPGNSFNLGDELVIITLPPLAGEKGRTGFSILDTVNMKLDIISTLCP